MGLCPALSCKFAPSQFKGTESYTLKSRHCSCRRLGRRTLNRCPGILTPKGRVAGRRDVARAVQADQEDREGVVGALPCIYLTHTPDERSMPARFLHTGISRCTTLNPPARLTTWAYPTPRSTPACFHNCAVRYGQVTLARHRDDKKKYVLKQQAITDAPEREKQCALQEAELMAKLKHPNVVSYRESFIEKG